MTALRSLLFLMIAPGMVAGYIPLACLRRGLQIESGVSVWLALPLFIDGTRAKPIEMAIAPIIKALTAPIS